ncbi:MAG: glycosyltransferase family 4 protein [bacterium]
MRRFLDNGWKVYALANEDKYLPILQKLNISTIIINFERSLFTPIKDIQTYRKLKKIYKQYAPVLIHHFHSKPIILGGMASRYLSNTKVINTVTGLGNAFVDGGIKELSATLGYTYSLKYADKTVFQNHDDFDFFISNKITTENKSEVIVSSGVDVSRFSPKEKGSDTNVKVLFLGRLLWEKGIKEYVESAQICKIRNFNMEFFMAGEIDKLHPSSIPDEWLDTVEKQGIVKYLGYRTDIEKLMNEIDIFVFPSYREGVPRVCLEAASCGKPVITTNVPGCKEAVIDNVTGYLVPVKDSQTLSDRILKLAKDKESRLQMGLKGREWMKRAFDVNIITEKYLDVYRSVGIDI